MSDGFFTVSGLLKACKDAGYDVVAITDHNVVTIPHPLQLREVKDLLVLRGIEVTFPRLHLICLEPQVTNMGVLGVIHSARVSWIAHPGLSMINPLECQEVCDREGLDGVELYNTGIRQFKGDLDGNFYAVDDLHVPSQLMTSWIEMDVDYLEKEVVLTKLKAGDYELYWREPPRFMWDYTEGHGGRESSTGFAKKIATQRKI